ncbi:unnamed protein product, partial [Arabidopsis halleri]
KRRLTEFFFFFSSMPRSSRWVNHRATSKTKKLILFLLVAFVFYLYRYPSSPSTVEQSSSSIYNISVKDIEGKDVSLSKFTGKVLLIVNVASRWYVTKYLIVLTSVFTNSIV